jgi:hypothetical protein
MFADARQRKFDLVLFWSLDRLSREGVSATLNHLGSGLPLRQVSSGDHLDLLPGRNRFNPMRRQVREVHWGRQDVFMTVEPYADEATRKSTAAPEALSRKRLKPTLR